ncbi:hypothetical protein HanRHA438_Chr09g0397821 [Helianthus annuus]|nr:hypothetical protein HanRHA438_Chr09g0397821 [Helianthus annuus]
MCSPYDTSHTPSDIYQFYLFWIDLVIIFLFHIRVSNFTRYQTFIRFHNRS